MSATTLTPEQVQLHLQHLASTTNFRVFPILAETVLYGESPPLLTAIFTVLICMSSYILITRGLRSRSSKMMLAVTLILYALSTWDWAIDIQLLRDDLKLFLPAELIKPVPDHARRVNVNTALHISQSITNNISTMLSDIIVCWRVYVLYGRNKRVLWTAGALLTALACGLLLCNMTQIGLGFPAVTHLHLLAPAELVIDIVTLILSALVNIWATCMITYQAWRCRREIRHHLKDTTRRSFAESMLALFAETGAVYTTLWILKNLIVLPVIEDTEYTDYAVLIMYQMTGMYPTVIIILVALKKSHLENQFTTYGGVTTNTHDIVFKNGGDSAYTPPLTSSSGDSEIIVSSRRVRRLKSDSNTDVASKDGEKSTHSLKGVNPGDILVIEPLPRADIVV
ncbi:hypothetical protein B0H19DRAFT_1269276 [Mycena capillaripes]|nr:hypothetical protein B0H19DRAFT_1269276 [Mycena capillaripes]